MIIPDCPIKCPLCGRENSYEFARMDRFAVLNCNDCGFRFVDSDSHDYPADAQYVYDEPILGIVRPGQPHIQRRVRDVIRYGGNTKGRSLDIGCGKGEVALAMRDAGFTSAGIDMKPHVIEQLRQRFPEIQWRCAMTSDLLDTTERFDVLTMYHVLEHISDPIDALMTVKNLAAPGALIVVEVPNVGGLKAKLQRSAWGYYKIDHVNYFRKRDLRLIGNKLGLEIVAVRGYQHFSYPQNCFWKDAIKGLAAVIGFQDVISAFYRVQG